MGGGETSHFAMDSSELTKIIFSRIQRIDPENVVKIMGCILLKDPNEQEMTQLAIGPESLLISMINDAKATLELLSPKPPSSSTLIHSAADPPHPFTSFSPGSRSFSSPSSSHALGPFWAHNLPSDSMEDYCLRKQVRCLAFEEQLDPGNPTGGFYWQDAALSSRATRRSPSLPEIPIKVCHYHTKGVCKHGANCKYFHGIHDDHSMAFSPTGNEYEDHGLLPGSLEKLEVEITELLRSMGGSPVSIASLPTLYFDKYGRNLQADGYLTESQRHGKAGFSLTKLLVRLKNSIRLIDRPHGQHSVILAENAKYLEGRNEMPTSSHQIYLTFPAESTFNEDDVSIYFNQFGPVQDVRIPSQDKRMFGFVSFHYPETVNTILMKRNPHYICGSRVLVKQYKERSRPMDRSYMDKMKLSMYHPSHYLEMEPEIHAAPRESDSSRLLRRAEEQERMMEVERMRLADFNLAQKQLVQQPYFSYGAELNAQDEFQLADHFSYVHEILNGCSTSDDKAVNTSNGFSDQERLIELPESPFASPPPVGSSIFTVT